MATPLGHALAGVAVGALMSRRRPLISPGKDLLLFVVLAQAPDLDFLPGILIGRPAAFHGGLTHSLGGSLVVGLILAWWGRKRGEALRWGLIGASICFTQVLVDALTLDKAAPLGVPIWWPILSDHFLYHPLFKDVLRGRLTWDLIRHNLIAMAWEMVLLMPLALLSLWARQRPEGKSDPGSQKPGR